MTIDTVGFVGLGNMGSVLASNLVERGFDVVVHDARGAVRAPSGTEHVVSVAEVAYRTDAVVLSLPDGTASETVTGEIVAASAGRTTHVIDTSTVGVSVARAIDGLLAEHGVAYLDAPVSGGVDGARARTLTVMYAGADEVCESVEPVLLAMSNNCLRVGDTPGLAQAMKLANNFLSATALAATSEAITFGRSLGLDMGTMLEVLNGSSGRSSATTDKFPDHVLTGRYGSGFTNVLMSKDVALYRRAVAEVAGPASIGTVTASVWERFATTEPGADFTRIFPFVESSRCPESDNQDLARE